MAERLPRVFGDYALLDRLGQGAAGDVYLARPIPSRRGGPEPVVIKRLLDKHTKDEEFIRRFRHESQIAVCIDSPYVAKVYAAGAFDETLYIAMEYVAGLPVSRFLTQLVAAKRYVPIAIAVELVAQGLAGLDAIHGARSADGRPLAVIHRDISPKNMMVGDDGVLRLIDLGFGKSNVQDWKTGTGIVLGSVGYMSPEQIQARALDHRADLYAMGVVLFELLTLRRYIKPDALPAMVAASLSQPFVAPSVYRPDVPRVIDDIVRRAVSPDPRDRYQSAAELIEVLHAAVVERVPPRLIAGFLDATLEAEVKPRRREVERLLGLPLPDEAEEDAENTRIDVYAVRTMANEVSVKTDAGFGGPLSALERLRAGMQEPGLQEPTEVAARSRRPGFDDDPSGKTQARTVLADRRGHGPVPEAAQAPTEIKPSHDATLLVSSRGTPRVSSVPLAASQVVDLSQSGTMSRVQPVPDVLLVEPEVASLFAGPRLWIVAALVVVAMTVGVAGGMLIASAREERIIIREPPAEAQRPARAVEVVPAARAGAGGPQPAVEARPPSPAELSASSTAGAQGARPSPPEPGEAAEDPTARRRRRVAAGGEPEPSPSRSEASNPSSLGGERARPEAGASLDDDARRDARTAALAEKARELQARASALKPRLEGRSAESAQLTKLLLELSLVSVSRNPERAEVQLVAIERGLQELER